MPIYLFEIHNSFKFTRILAIHDPDTLEYRKPYTGSKILILANTRIYANSDNNIHIDVSFIAAKLANEKFYKLIYFHLPANQPSYLQALYDLTPKPLLALPSSFSEDKGISIGINRD